MLLTKTEIKNKETEEVREKKSRRKRNNRDGGGTDMLNFDVLH